MPTQAHPQSPSAWLHYDADTNSLNCGGDWRYHEAPNVARELKSLLSSIQQKSQLTLQGEEITHCDTSGGVILANFIDTLKQQKIDVELKLSDQQQHLLDLVNHYTDQTPNTVSVPLPTIIYRLGEWAHHKWQMSTAFLAFIGELAHRLLLNIKHPSRFRHLYFFNVLQRSGLAALPLIAFLSFLIGVVLTYQIGLQLRLYGANIFVVNLLGMSILREFGPLITAILVAGRSGSAYTAQIGTMAVREEIDALRTMGLSPFDFLVLPRVVALMIILPLLTVWSIIFSFLGGMMMCQSMLDITYYEFLHRLRTEISLDTYLLGLIKTPVFGLTIAAVGCFQGFRVTGSAASVGQQTTKSVVQALFLIIILDALFSVIFSLAGF